MGKENDDLYTNWRISVTVRHANEDKAASPNLRSVFSSLIPTVLAHYESPVMEWDKMPRVTRN